MLALALRLALATTAGGPLAADHREAPIVANDPAADLNDIYIFRSPADNDNIVFAMTVNPFIAPTSTSASNFPHDIRYRFLVDFNNDQRPDRTVEINFSRLSGGMQDYTIRLPDGSRISGQATRPSVAAVAPAPIIATNGDGVMAFAGQRDDPFFFDGVGFARFRAGTGTFSGQDSFGGFNVSAIVVEFPIAMLNPPDGLFQVWGVTERQRVAVRRSSSDARKLVTTVGTWVVVDRTGNPGVSTAFIPGAKRDLFNVAKPARDGVDFGPDIVAALQSLGTDSTNISILASVAVPDTLKVNLNQPTEFPNGRGLADDVIDTLLFFIFNQTPTADMVDDNDVMFLNTFPYMAPPHQPS